MNIDEIIASAQRPERTVRLCLRGDLRTRWDELEQQLRELDQDASDADTLAGDPRATEIAEQMAAVEDEMRKQQVSFRFRGLPSTEYSDLMAKHSTKGKDGEDDVLDWKVWPTALIAACAVEPAMTFEQATKLSQTVSNKQWDELFAGALAVNRTDVDVPFSLSASAIRAATGQNSKPPAPGVSLAAVSSDESLAG